MLVFVTPALAGRLRRASFHLSLSVCLFPSAFTLGVLWAQLLLSYIDSGYITPYSFIPIVLKLCMCFLHGMWSACGLGIIVRTFFCHFLAHLSSAQDELLWSLFVRRPSVRPCVRPSVRPCVRPLTFSNDFSSETAEPILLKFHMEPP